MAKTTGGGVPLKRNNAKKAPEGRSGKTPCKKGNSSAVSKKPEHKNTHNGNSGQKTVLSDASASVLYPNEPDIKSRIDHELWKIYQQSEEHRQICLRSHAVSEKETSSFVKEANQANKIKIDVLEKLGNLHSPIKPFAKTGQAQNLWATGSKKNFQEIPIDELKNRIFKKIREVREKGRG